MTPIITLARLLISQLGLVKELSGAREITEALYIYLEMCNGVARRDEAVSINLRLSYPPVGEESLALSRYGKK